MPPPPFVVQAAGVDKSRVSGVAQAWEVALFEVGEGRGELVGVLLLVVLSGADEGRRRIDEPFRERHGTFQSGIPSRLGCPRFHLNAGNPTCGMRYPPWLMRTQTKDPAAGPGLVARLLARLTRRSRGA